MASASSIAIRREAAIAAIAAATGADLTVRAKDPRLKEAMVLEAIAAALVPPVADAPSGNATTGDGPTDLPDDFPGRDALMDAGHTTIDAVRAATDLTAITGIGKATAAAITESLAALPPAPTATNDGAAA